MKMTVKKRIGRELHNFIVEGETMYDVLSQANKLSFGDVEKCGICGSDDLVLGAHKAKGKFEYVDIKCLNYECRASLTFGKRADEPDTFFLRKTDAIGVDGKKIKMLDWKVYAPS